MTYNPPDAASLDISLKFPTVSSAQFTLTPNGGIGHGSTLEGSGRKVPQWSFTEEGVMAYDAWKSGAENADG